MRFSGWRKGCGMLDSTVRIKTSFPGGAMTNAVLAVVTLCLCPAVFAASVINMRLEDPKAVYLDAPATTGDSSAALQAAIDKASGTGREGIVFVPAGSYIRDTNSVSVARRAAHRLWRNAPGIRTAAEFAGISERDGRDGDVHGAHASRASAGRGSHCISSTRVGASEQQRELMPIRIRFIRR